MRGGRDAVGQGCGEGRDAVGQGCSEAGMRGGRDAGRQGCGKGRRQRLLLSCDSFHLPDLRHHLCASRGVSSTVAANKTGPFVS